MRAEASVQILSRAGNVQGSLDAFASKGTVTGSLKSSPTKTLALTVVDPHGRVQWLPDSPSESGVYAGRQLRVILEINGRRDAIFTGPILDARRRNSDFDLACVGREHHGLGRFTSQHGVTVGPPMNTGQAITAVLATGELAGHSVVCGVPLREPVTLEPFGESWRVAEDIADRANRQLYFDGWGRLRIRRWPRTATHTFRTGPTGNIKGEPPEFGYRSDFANHVVIISPDPCGGDPVIAEAIATGDYAPSRIGRMFHVEEIEGLDQAAANERAGDLLDGFTMRESTASFQAVPEALELGDVARVVDLNGAALRMRAEDVTWQLPASGPMSVGSIRRGPLGRH